MSISNKQREHYTGEEWVTIRNAIDASRYEYSAKQRPYGYLAFLGRLTENKGVDLAIDVAKETGLPLRIAGCVPDEPGSVDFFESKIRPELNDKIVWIGEITDDQKSGFFRDAQALLVPIRWDEPFGLVVIEAMACGTPVIAMSRGAMPEIIKNGINGYLVNDEEEMIDAVSRISAISREVCRRDCERRFSVDLMVECYLETATALLETKAARRR